MRLKYLVFLLLVCCASAFAEELPIVRDVHYPALNADATKVAFCYQGDLWVAKVDDGIATRLTVSDAYEARPRWSPDGSTIAFISDRHGSDDIFTVPAAGGHIERVTHHSASDVICDWSADGTKLLFSSSGRGHRWVAPHEIDLDTGYVRPVLLDACSVSVTGYSPDGGKITGIRRGTAWWRKGHRGAHPSLPASRRRRLSGSILSL